jgi:hypothetical protein
MPRGCDNGRSVRLDDVLDVGREDRSGVVAGARHLANASWAAAGEQLEPRIMRWRG